MNETSGIAIMMRHGEPMEYSFSEQKRALKLFNKRQAEIMDYLAKQPKETP